MLNLRKLYGFKNIYSPLNTFSLISYNFHITLVKKINAKFAP